MTAQARPSRVVACSACGTVSLVPGRQSRCRPCRNAYKKAWVARQRQKMGLPPAKPRRPPVVLVRSIESLRSRCLEVNGCWVWQGLTRRRGYGRAKVSGERVQGVHRVMYEIVNGPIPKGMLVCHHCDNPPCLNPAHLFLGTPQDNMRDMHEKGRHRCVLPILAGERNPLAKLKWKQVEEIRQRYAAGEITIRKLALEYGVSRPSIQGIIRGRTWVRRSEAS